ncbi:MAG: inorganic phosphate transporter, partial [Burkholderia contaminans]
MSRTSSKASCWKTPERINKMHSIQLALWMVATLVLVALVFDFMNGFHDAANSIAT